MSRPIGSDTKTRPKLPYCIFHNYTNNELFPYNPNWLPLRYWR